jgi:hypothetical protein
VNFPGCWAWCARRSNDILYSCHNFNRNYILYLYGVTVLTVSVLTVSGLTASGLTGNMTYLVISFSFGLIREEGVCHTELT